MAKLAAPLHGAAALEIGGPSALFGTRGRIPVYLVLQALDACNFATETIWSGTVAGSVVPDNEFVSEASALTGVPDDRYDAVLASHVLEHVADPIGALVEWRRVIRPFGHLLLVVPHRDGTFDHRRPVTDLSHMRADAADRTAETDLTHLDEVIRLHDSARDRNTRNRAWFERRSRENPRHRALHHHVFDTQTVALVCHEAGYELIALATLRPFHIVCLARKPESGPAVLAEDRVRAALARSPFPTDRTAVQKAARA